MDPAEPGFSFTTTMFLDVLYTLLLMVVFFLVGVSNPTSFIAFGTEIMPSEAATICTASHSFSSLDNAEVFFDMLVDVCSRWEPLRWMSLPVFHFRTRCMRIMTLFETKSGYARWLLKYTHCSKINQTKSPTYQLTYKLTSCQLS